jgi:dienelactone hydrolase
MKISCWRERRFACVLLLLGVGLPGLSAAQLVEPVFDLRQPATAPYPSNRYSSEDSRNLTGIRIAMPKPSCTTRPSDCADIDVLNTLDGFNLQPRFRVPFSGSINLSTVNSDNIFLVRLRDPTRSGVSLRTIGINQVMWDPATNSLSFESEELLEQHTEYLMVVTTSVRDTRGNPLWSDDFWDFITDPTFYRYGCCELSDYRLDMLDALDRADISPFRIVSASLFTTMSTTSALEKIRDQIKAATPAAANFLLATDGSRTNFPIASVQSMVVQRQIRTTPTFQAETVGTPALGAVPGAVGSVAFGRYSSPDYMATGRYIPEIFTRTGTPLVQRTNPLYFTLILPSGTKPAGGWPVAIYGHGFTSNRETIMAFASVLASRGIATIAISVVGHGGGSAGTLTVNRTSGTPVTLPVGGRGTDMNGDGLIEVTEGISAMPPRAMIQFRDGMRQTVIDLMQLVRVIETNGMDANGDGSTDLNGQRIYYFGISLGGMYGPILLALDPSVSAGVSIVAGGTIMDLARMGAFRGLPAQALANRTPSLINAPGSPAPGAPVFAFSENMPLRNKAPLVNNVAGAVDIQEYFERWEWVSNSGDPLAYTRHVRAQPLAGMQPKQMIFQFAKGDKTVPNPTNSAMVRAGNLLDRTTYFRNDLAYAANPTTVPKDPHAFAGRLDLPALQKFALQAQTQMAVFFQSDGGTLMDPDGSDVFFETPILGSLPEELNFIP